MYRSPLSTAETGRQLDARSFVMGRAQGSALGTGYIVHELASINLPPASGPFRARKTMSDQATNNGDCRRKSVARGGKGAAGFDFSIR